MDHRAGHAAVRGGTDAGGRSNGNAAVDLGVETFRRERDSGDGEQGAGPRLTTRWRMSDYIEANILNGMPSRGIAFRP